MDGSQSTVLAVDFEDGSPTSSLARPPARVISGNPIAAIQTAALPLVLLWDFTDAAGPHAWSLGSILLICGFAIAAFHWAATWRIGSVLNASQEVVRRALHVAALAFLATIVSNLVDSNDVHPRSAATFLALVSIAWAGIGASAVTARFRRRRATRCVMIFGHGKTALDLSQQVKRQMPWAKVCIWPGEPLQSPSTDTNVDIPACAHPRIVELAPDVALISDSERSETLSSQLAPFAIDVLVSAPCANQRTVGELVQLAGMSFVRVYPKPLRQHQRVLKRAFDITLGLVLLIVLSPLLCLIALIIKIDSRGPVFFLQPRVGEHGSHFTIWKFRTMADQAGDRLGWTPTVMNDPRVTRIGGILRKASLDELPQLFNVLLGSMSLVGPRPHAMNGNQFSLVMDNYDARHRVKPGITGLAQVRGWRGPTDTPTKIEQRIANDLHYISEWSLSRDVVIIARTVFALCGRNAF